MGIQSLGCRGEGIYRLVRDGGRRRGCRLGGRERRLWGVCVSDELGKGDGGFERWWDGDLTYGLQSQEHALPSSFGCLGSVLLVRRRMRQLLGLHRALMHLNWAISIHRYIVKWDERQICNTILQLKNAIATLLITLKTKVRLRELCNASKILREDKCHSLCGTIKRQQEWDDVAVFRLVREFQGLPHGQPKVSRCDGSFIVTNCKTTESGEGPV